MKREQPHTQGPLLPDPRGPKLTNFTENKIQNLIVSLSLDLMHVF